MAVLAGALVFPVFIDIDCPWWLIERIAIKPHLEIDAAA
jgi:hypothetical protein